MRVDHHPKCLKNLVSSWWRQHEWRYWQNLFLAKNDVIISSNFAHKFGFWYWS